MPPKKLALLVAGFPPDSVTAEFGDYPIIYHEFFELSIPRGSKFTLDKYNVYDKMEYPPEDTLDSYDAIVLTGSAFNAYEDKEWINKLVAYIARIARDKPKIKIIGICFGHQIVARAFGGECVPNGKWEVGPTPLDLTDLGKQVFGVETLNIQSMHRDHVPSVPPPLQLLGSTSISRNQGMVLFDGPDQSLESIRVFTVQGHPEYVQGVVAGIVKARVASGVMTAELAADLERRKDWRNDGVEVLGKTIWGILGVTA